MTARSTGASAVWTVSLKPAPSRNDFMLATTYNGITPAEMAEKRARLLLLGDLPVPRGAGRDDYLTAAVLGPLKELGVTGPVLPDLLKGRKGPVPDLLRHARLHLAFWLRAGGVCDDLLELRLGPEQKGGIAVRFRGRRRGRYAGDAPQDIRVEGICPLRGS